MWFGTTKNLSRKTEDLSSSLAGLLIRMSESKINHSLSAAWAVQLEDLNSVSEMFQTFQAEISNGNDHDLRALFLDELDVGHFKELIGLVGIELQSVYHRKSSADDNVVLDYRPLIFGKVIF
jgi:hypothetical protein